LYRTTFRTWDDNAYDAFMQATVLDYLRTNRPRVLFVGYGETDEWAHSGRYDRVLRSARAVDAYIAELWRTLQSMPEYRGTTSMIVTTDHGRGAAGTSWRDHGENIDGAENVWIAVVGPNTPALGERTNTERVTQSQVAGTLAALLGQPYPNHASAIGAAVKR
jgi:bisphosphoglycerate-independent phosphoglycerate mutase (AlkP superfamily)